MRIGSIWRSTAGYHVPFFFNFCFLRFLYNLYTFLCFVFLPPEGCWRERERERPVRKRRPQVSFARGTCPLQGHTDFRSALNYSLSIEVMKKGIFRKRDLFKIFIFVTISTRSSLPAGEMYTQKETPTRSVPIVIVRYPDMLLEAHQGFGYRLVLEKAVLRTGRGLSSLVDRERGGGQGGHVAPIRDPWTKLG